MHCWLIKSLDLLLPAKYSKVPCKGAGGAKSHICKWGQDIISLPWGKNRIWLSFDVDMMRALLEELSFQHSVVSMRAEMCCFMHMLCLFSFINYNFVYNRVQGPLSTKECLAAIPIKHPPADNQRERLHNKVSQWPLARVQILQLTRKNETTRLSKKTVWGLPVLVSVQKRSNQTFAYRIQLFGITSTISTDKFSEAGCQDRKSVV